jgi:N-hydroxyarylamine O-acetyltransferase
MTSEASTDMEAREYLHRIGAQFPKGPTLEGLRDLHLAHLRAAPFENLDIYRGVPIVLDQERILKKVVADRRGGFCYELNTAFHWLLKELGYQVALLAAEVARPEGGFGIPFDHMTLLAQVDGDAWLADVGFGDSFLRPLRFVEGEVHVETEYRYRLTRRGRYWHMERAPSDGDGYLVQYRFTTVPRQLADYQGGCEYHQTSPDSTFTQKVVATRALEDGRVTVTRDRVILRQAGARSEIPLADEAAFYSALARHVGIQMETA